jgi:DNA-binding transcriptional ArsR family regulator
LLRSSDDVFRVLADPTRRRILDLLADHGPQTVGQLAAEFPDLVSSGISKHLMGLRAAGLVSATDQGRQRLYRIEADTLSDALAPWLARYEPYWSAALTRLRDLAEAEPPHPTVDRAQVTPRRVRSSPTRRALRVRET